MIHRTFLFWLLYLVVVLFGIGSAFYLGLPQTALHYDHSYLTFVLFGMYLLAEVLSGCEAWRISKENLIADQAIGWLSRHRLSAVTICEDGGAYLHTGNKAAVSIEDYRVPPSAIAEHFSLLCVKANSGQRDIKQNTLIEVTADRLYDTTMIAEFIAARIVWVGILATILGVIMAFWPMIDGVSIDAMKSNMGRFFGGIAVAFIPTAVSFVFKIVLDCNTRIITTGVRNLIDKVACVSDTNILPFLDTDGTTTIMGD